MLYKHTIYYVFIGSLVCKAYTYILHIKYIFRFELFFYIFVYLYLCTKRKEKKNAKTFEAQ